MKEIDRLYVLIACRRLKGRQPIRWECEYVEGLESAQEATARVAAWDYKEEGCGLLCLSWSLLVGGRVFAYSGDPVFSMAVTCADANLADATSEPFVLGIKDTLLKAQAEREDESVLDERWEINPEVN